MKGVLQHHLLFLGEAQQGIELVPQLFHLGLDHLHLAFMKVLIVQNSLALLGHFHDGLSHSIHLQDKPF